MQAHTAQRITLPVTLLVQAASSAATLAPTVAAPRLLPALQLGTAAVGLYMAMVYAAALLSSQWGAALVRRWGPIRTSQISLNASGAGCLLMAVPHRGASALGAVLIGIGYGPITPASSDMLARSTRPDRVALVFSIKQTGVPLGGAIAGLLVPSILLHAGLASALLSISAMCLMACGLAQWLRPSLDSVRNPDSPLPVLADIARPMRLVLAHPILQRAALATLVFSTVQVSLTSFLVSFLAHDLQWTLVAAGAAASLAQGAGVVGRIAWGAWSDRLIDGPRRLLRGLSVAMALAGLAASQLVTATPTSVVLLVVTVFGATAIGWNGVFLGTVARVVPRHEIAMATAGSLFFTFLGVVIGPPLFGLAGEQTGSLGTAFAWLAAPLFIAYLLIGPRWPVSSPPPAQVT